LHAGPESTRQVPADPQKMLKLTKDNTAQLNVVTFASYMTGSSQRLKYHATGLFSPLILDYLSDAPSVRPFFQLPPSRSGFEQAIQQRKNFPVNRKALVTHLQQQYETVAEVDAVSRNINLLLEEHTFTVTTAHQPNLFTGPLYFVYKILHTIHLAEWLRKEFPGNSFIPVYYMGNEDADFEELSHCTIQGMRYQWKTDQSGAFGRMVIDKEITRLLQAMSGQLLVQPHGKEIIDALTRSFREKNTIQQATFELVHFLFARFGLVVLIPDSKELKQLMIPAFEQELIHRSSSAAVQQTISELEQHYKVQTGGRDINLFYLDEDVRERIEAVGDAYAVANTTIRFTKEELLQELRTHPERFSPNVILRGLYQETILPNLAFTGGGGELAYWLELKNVFSTFGVPFPVLLLRNSFLLLNGRQEQQARDIGFAVADFFDSTEALLNRYVKQNSKQALSLEEQRQTLSALYATTGKQATGVDPTLTAHVQALYKQADKRLQELEKKLLRAEKRKFTEQAAQITRIKEELFPNGSFQERKESVIGFYAQYGSGLLDLLASESLTVEQEFTVLTLHQSN
jgi:bacillithiol biosynthesis cysteine-adding enzyme BshC